jgi:hypothetical protein
MTSDNQLETARKALCSNKKGLTVMNLSREIKVGYQTAYRIVTVLKVAGEIEPAGFVLAKRHQAQVWKLKA